MKTILVLGGSGMLGSMVADVLSRQAQFAVAATIRTDDLRVRCRSKLPAVDWRLCDATGVNQAALRAVIGDARWVVNAIGIIKPYVHDDIPAEVERAVRINALFPYVLARAAEEVGARVIQIATDCVYSGKKGNYAENDAHDALDVYGKTKSLGESFLPNVFSLRCSIIGPEPRARVSLLEWFLSQPKQGAVTGYTNHQWNGVTTLHFARLCGGIIQAGEALPHVQHVIPAGSISKAELLQCFSREFKRADIGVNPGQAKTVIDRTLATNNQRLNQQLWEKAGYARLPSVPEMVAELAAFDYRMGAL